MQIITNNLMGVGGCMSFEARNLIVLEMSSIGRMRSGGQTELT